MMLGWCWLSGGCLVNRPTIARPLPEPNTGSTITIEIARKNVVLRPPSLSLSVCLIGVAWGGTAYRACIGSSSAPGVVGAVPTCFRFSMFSLLHAPFMVFDEEKHSFMMNGNFVPL
uniref:Putative secreted protein n=1 Tax=Anopheles darlingi TaxID=43151 RepID=A0A2M4D7V6_ANODA